MKFLKFFLFIYFWLRGSLLLVEVSGASHSIQVLEYKLKNCGARA